MNDIASEWEVDPKLPFLRHPAPGTEQARVGRVRRQPGRQGRGARSREKMKNDYGGHANQLKDLARLTLRFSAPRKLADALDAPGPRL